MSSLDENGMERKDGFRKRRKRPANWEAKAIKAGAIPNPNAAEPTPIRRGPNDTVVEPPVATLSGDSN